MKKLVFLLMAILVASSAFAVIDPDTDMLGLYFDEAADTPSLQMDAGGLLDIYLILTNPSEASVKGFECKFEFEADPSFQYTPMSWNGEGLNVGEFPNMLVGFGAPVPTTEATVLGSISTYVISPAGSMVFYIRHSDPETFDDGLPAVLRADNSAYPVGISNIDGRVAAINADVVATEAISLDNIKSLYR